ncbi:hypothetical protein KSP40_PGU001883 [Platanthera guangdongensis]|uniref:Uncharacterized protein n=1 Tax=Platanthera guangdongensis TaxID=2320717 RepID=A0ABR2MTX2_9ASPA
MTEGSVEWVVNLFAFYSRLSLSPSTLLEFRHENVANLNCNKPFIYVLWKGVEEFRSCYCSNFTQVHRLRHVLPGYKRFQKWHRYHDASFYMYSIVLVFLDIVNAHWLIQIVLVCVLALSGFATAMEGYKYF